MARSFLRISKPAREGGSNQRRLRLVVELCLTATILSALVACGEEETGRRFANETPPTVDPASYTPTSTPFVSASTPVVAPPELSPEALIVSRGAPRFFYVQSGDEVLAFSASGEAMKSVWRGKRNEVRDIVSSPNGERAAILTRKGSRYDVTVVDHEGNEIKTFERIRRPLGSGTPVPATNAGRDLLDWSPQGNTLLAAFSSGGIVGLPLDGEAELLLSPQQAPGPLAAGWSPAGNAIAFVNRPDENSPSRLYRFDLAGGDSEPVELFPKSDDTASSVTTLEWLPDASAILFARTNPEDELPQGGDLLQIPAKGGDAKIIVSAKRAAPVAAIVEVMASPSGRSMAYTVVIPGAGAPEFHSLWVQQLGTSSATRISTPAGERLTEAWYVDGGIAYRTEPAEPQDGDVNSVAVYLVGGDGERRQIYATGSLAPATPEASPVGSPLAAATPER